MSVNEFEKNELNNESNKDTENKEELDEETKELKDQTTESETEDKEKEATEEIKNEISEEIEKTTEESAEDVNEETVEELNEETTEADEEKNGGEEEKLFTPDGEAFEDDTNPIDRVFGDDENSEKRNDEKNGSFVRGLFEILEMLGIAIAVVVLIITFFFRFSNVDGESMTYTINEKDTLLVSMAFYEPKKGDIIIFQAPDYDVNKPLVKRVIATEGDSLEINFDTWEVKVNGVILDEDYVRYHPYLPDGEDELYLQKYPDWDMDSQSVGAIEEGSYDPVSKIFTATIPEGHVFAMGDNRNNSHDSRSADIGMVDERYIVGKVICRLFPFEDFGAID